MLHQSVYEGESIMTQYRILKLRSGEEIITKITGKQKGKMILERPMIFRTMMVHDGLGRPKEVTVLRNWTPNTNEIHAKIPEDYIATFLTPSMEAVKLYELEKDQEDRIEMLLSIKYIDEVWCFNSTKELRDVIKINKPDIMVIGSDWKGKKVIGQEHARRLDFFDRVGDYSTTNILEKK